MKGRYHSCLQEELQTDWTEWFKENQRMRQGCTLSPWLFNVFLDTIVARRQGGKEARRQGGKRGKRGLHGRCETGE